MTRPLFRFLDAGDAIRRRDRRGFALEPTWQAVRRSLIDEALVACDGNPSAAAKMLGETLEYVLAHCDERDRPKGRLSVVNGGAA
jgi:hypothetical protein